MRGGVVRLLPGELLDAHGMVTQRSMNAGAKNPDLFTYMLKGGGVETWHPRFSYTVFRYFRWRRRASTRGYSAVGDEDCRAVSA